MKSHAMIQALAGLAVSALWQPPLYAATAGDWPCVQRKVPSLSPGTYWAGPDIEAVKDRWQDDRGVARLVARLVSRRTGLEEAAALIAAFAEAQKEGRAERLTLVFAGAFAELNRLRSELIAGIERFTRRQRALADQIRADRRALRDLRSVKDPSERDRQRIQELETKIQWQTRIHADRESSLTYVCETPVLLDQRVFAIARAIQNVM